LTQPAKQSIRADGEAEFSGKACTRFTSDGEADQLQRGIQPHILSGVMCHDGRKSFAEDVLRTEAVQAAEAPSVQFQLNGERVPGQISDVTSVAAMSTR
jgi:hypothetical protein